MVDPFQKAKTQAFLLLKVRPRSESEMRNRLLKKGHDSFVVDALLQELKAKGLLNDLKFAQYFATQQMHMRPQGRRALLRALRSKGVDLEIATGAVENAAEGKEELELARGLAQSRMSHLKGVPEEAVKRRLFGFLSRRGFTSETVYQVVREFSHTIHEDL